MVGVDDIIFKSYPLLLILISRQPNGRVATVLELMHNPIALFIDPIAQMNRMEAPGLVSLDVFRVIYTLWKEEACIYMVSFRV